MNKAIEHWQSALEEKLNKNNGSKNNKLLATIIIWSTILIVSFLNLAGLIHCLMNYTGWGTVALIILPIALLVLIHNYAQLQTTGGLSDEIKEKLKKEELQKLQLEYQKQLSKIPIDSHFVSLTQKLTDVKKAQLKGDFLNNYLKLYEKMKTNFEDLGFISADKLLTISDDAQRINQIEVIMDLYDRKIQAVKSDSSLDEDEKEEKIDYWKRLRDRDITEAEE